MDAAVAVALIFAGLALGIAIGAILLALRAGRTDAAAAGGIGAGAAGSETLHRSYSYALDEWFKLHLVPHVKRIHAAVEAHHGGLGDAGIKDPPTPPGGP